MISILRYILPRKPISFARINNFIRSKATAPKKAKATAKAKGPEKAKKPPPNLKTFQIFRYDPEKKGSSSSMKSYTIDLNDCRPTILDALMMIKTEQDSALAFRKSCREGICGSCGMNIDGINGLACTRKIIHGGVTKIYPLPHMYVIKDLIVDFNQFLKQHDRIKPYLITKDKKTGDKQYVQSGGDRDALIGLAECILCACCSTSCPEYWWHGHTKPPNDFLGPAALLNAYRWIVDTRDEGTEERLNQLKNYYSLYRCHQINNCSTCCPKRLTPGRVIAKLRLLVGGIGSRKEGDLKGTAKSDPNKACGDKGQKGKC